MIYQRQNKAVIKGTCSTDYRLERSIQSGFKFIEDDHIVYSTSPYRDRVQAENAVEWVVHNEQNFNILSIMQEYLTMLRKMKPIYGNTLQSFILRKKIETLCVNDKKSMLEKYEIKIRIQNGTDGYLICAGGTGKFDDIINKTDLWSEIHNKIAFYRLSCSNFKYTGKMMVLLGNQATGFLCHEAIGHMAECDMIEKGSAFKDKLGQELFDKRISIVDSGKTEYGAGNICFDEEGTEAGSTFIIRDGALNSYSNFPYQLVC
mgnify:CR=1 FL=1